MLYRQIFTRKRKIRKISKIDRSLIEGGEKTLPSPSLPPSFPLFLPVFFCNSFIPNPFISYLCVPGMKNVVLKLLKGITVCCPKVPVSRQPGILSVSLYKHLVTCHLLLRAQSGGLSTRDPPDTALDLALDARGSPKNPSQQNTLPWFHFPHPSTD